MRAKGYGCFTTTENSQQKTLRRPRDMQSCKNISKGQMGYDRFLKGLDLLIREEKRQGADNAQWDNRGADKVLKMQGE
jgi:hypothetical protein